MTDQEHYRHHGYAAAPGLFAPEVLRAFYNQMTADLQASGRSLGSFAARGPLLRQEAIEVYAHVYTPMLTFLWGLTPRVEATVGRALLPTYAYFRAYRGGDVCLVHSDRPACEHSLSLTLLLSDDEPWALSVGTTRIEDPQPLVAEDFGGEPHASMSMRAGDGVLYQGVHHRHGRLDPNPNAWSAHLFLHWVEKDGRYADHAFDRVAQARARAAATA
jgi:hypothetical protein